MIRINALFLLATFVLGTVGCDGAGDQIVTSSGNSQADDGDNGVETTTSGGFIAGEPGEGIWHGTLKSDSSEHSLDLIGLIDGWGGMRLLGPDSQYLGQIDRHDLQNNEAEFTVNGTRIAINGTTWPDGSRTVPFSISGTLAPTTRTGASDGGEIRADYTDAAVSGSISLSFDPASNRAPSLERLDGMWVVRDETENIAATFGISAGALEGSDKDGCVYAGDMSVDPFGHSSLLFEVYLTVSNCPMTSTTNSSGLYRGSAGITDLQRNSAESDWLIIGVNNEDIDRAITLSLQKM